MTVLGKSVLGLWIDLVPEYEAQFNEWYRTEHLAERVAVPGFLRGRRFQTVRPASPKYFTLYETVAPEVLRSEPYITMLNNPTPGSQANLPNVRNGFRTAYTAEVLAGNEDGTVIATVRFEPGALLTDHILDRFRQVVPAVAAVPGVTSVVLCEAEREATGIMTTERRIGGASTPAAAYLLLVEADTAETLESAALEAILAPGAPTWAGLTDLIHGAYAHVQTSVHLADGKAT